MGGGKARARRLGWWPGWPKRAFDFVVASVGLIVLAPLLGVIALAIRLVLGRPVIFAQRRPGRHREEIRGAVRPDQHRRQVAGPGHVAGARDRVVHRVQAGRAGDGGAARARRRPVPVP